MIYTGIQVIINGSGILANTASLTENYPLSEVKSLGIAGSSGLWADNRSIGTVNIEYYLKSDDSHIRNLTGISLINGYIGDIKFNSGLLTSYSISAEPFALITATATFEFYNGITIETGHTGQYDATGDFTLMKGEETEVIDGVGFNNKVLNYNYSISQNFEPIYVIGESYPSGFIRGVGQIEIGIEGTGIAETIDWPCQEVTNSSITFSSTCGDSFEIQTSGLKVENLEIRTSVNEEFIGNVKLRKNF